jgi:hypothetical protein
MSAVFGVATNVGVAGAVAPPANDKLAGATVVTHLPYSNTENTAGATLDADDIQAGESNPACVPPFTPKGSVWYKLTPAATTVALIDTAGSSYETGIGIATGSPGALTVLSCGINSLSAPVTGGTNYYIAVIDFAGNGGGSLKFHINAPGKPPANDLSTGAKRVRKLPFKASLDTSGATTDAQDAQANESCGAPHTNNSVWYAFTAGAKDSAMLVDTTGSNYSSGVIIATGTPGALTTIACSPVAAVATVSPGTTYYVIVFDDTGFGGKLKLSIGAPPAAPTLSLAFNAAGTVDSTGSALLGGSYTCTSANLVEIQGSLVEIVGSQVVVGNMFENVANPKCNGKRHPFAITAVPDAGLPFAAGQSAELSTGLACNVIQCTTYDTRQVVTLG